MRAQIYFGSRHWADPKPILKALLKFQPKYVITGGQDGADALAHAEAWKRRKNGVITKVFEAEWGKYGLSAGAIRNGEMLKFLLTLKDDYDISCVGFPLDEAKGSRNMAFQALKKGVMVYTYKTVLKFPMYDLQTFEFQ